MIVYIRHGHDDEELMFSQHEDDVELLRQGWMLSQVRARRLIRYFGVPQIIRCSPFQRAVDTARSMIKWIEKHYAVKVQIEVDCSLSRLFSKEEQESPDLSPQTALSPIPIKEKWKDFCKRVADHTSQMVNNVQAYLPTSKIWCISHSVVLLQIAELHHKTIRDPVEYLDWFHVKKVPCSDCLAHAQGIAPQHDHNSTSSNSDSDSTDCDAPQEIEATIQNDDNEEEDEDEDEDEDEKN